MSSEGKLIGICSRGERFWWPADREQDKCPDPDCGCEPTFYVPSPEVERLREAIRAFLVAWGSERDLEGPHVVDLTSEIEALHELVTEDRA